MDKQTRELISLWCIFLVSVALAGAMTFAAITSDVAWG